MAHGDICNCDVCGKQYTYCERCSIIKPDYNANRFCSHEHQDIFAILSKHGCNLITSEEAFLELSEYNIDEISLTEDILTHIVKIHSDIGLPPIVEEEVIADETQIVETSNKNKKKKW